MIKFHTWVPPPGRVILIQEDTGDLYDCHTTSQGYNTRSYAAFNKEVHTAIEVAFWEALEREEKTEAENQTPLSPVLGLTLLDGTPIEK